MSLVNILPFVQYHYSLKHDLIDCCDSEHMNGSLNFTEHSDILYTKAYHRFGLLKKTCRFVKSVYRNRSLYLTMVRSIFEHCHYVWRSSSQTAMNRLESLQKSATKWKLNKNSVSSIIYSINHHLNLIHSKQLDILPI